MIGFLKRRWILLSCAVVLLVCTFTNWRIQIWKTAIGATVLANGQGYIGINGSVGMKTIRWVGAPLHTPMFGKSPHFRWVNTSQWILIPLWLPLSTVLGWLTFRELRWREKRGKEAEVP